MSTVGPCLTKSPLESWITRNLAVREASLTRELIAQYQLKAIRETSAWARSHSSFYAQRLAALPGGFPRCLEDISRLPLTSAADLAENTPGFLCVSQSEISRVVTLQSSGTSGAPKRMFFTPADQELGLDFFANAVATVAAPGDRMMIALPGEREGSVGYQLATGVARAGVIPILHGLSIDPAQTLARMDHEKATCIIALPVQMLALAMFESAHAKSAMRRLHSIVLCSDHVPAGLVRTLRHRSEAEIFEHYGMTEMGLGGGIDCEAHMGYHLREADLYFEIVNPETGEPLPDGEVGEVVFTTLNRTGMPLIRYRTGDISRFVPGPCACGTILKRLEQVHGRVDASICVGTSSCINISMLDDALFAVPGLLDFSAVFFQGARARLELTVYAPEVDDLHFNAMVLDALRTLPATRDGFTHSELQIEVAFAGMPFPVTGAKRRIEVRAGQ